MRLDLAAVTTAQQRAGHLIRRTPVLPGVALSTRLGATIAFKADFLQDTGSFKLRGAANAICALDGEQRERGVVTFSTGNHGRAVAHVSALLGVEATVCLSELVPMQKREAIKAAGGCLHVEGTGQDDAARVARRLVADRGLALIDPLDDPLVLAGHGTLALELAEQVEDLSMLLVPVSAGGLISGIAVAIKALRPHVRLIGVGAAANPAMARSQLEGRPVDVQERSSLADSLGGGIAQPNRYTFATVRELVDDLVLVEEEAIADALAWMILRERLLVEGAAAVGVAALLSGRVTAPPTGTTAVVLSGNAIDAATIVRVLDRSTGTN